MSKIQWEYDVVEKPAWDKTCRGGFAQKILGGHRPPLQLGVRNCRALYDRRQYSNLRDRRRS